MATSGSHGQKPIDRLFSSHACGNRLGRVGALDAAASADASSTADDRGTLGAADGLAVVRPMSGSARSAAVHASSASGKRCNR